MLYLKSIDAPAIRFGDREIKALEVHAFAPARQAPQLMHDQPADGVVNFVIQLAAEELVEILDIPHPPDA